MSKILDAYTGDRRRAPWAPTWHHCRLIFWRVHRMESTIEKNNRY